MSLSKVKKQWGNKLLKLKYIIKTLINQNILLLIALKSNQICIPSKSYHFYKLWFNGVVNQKLFNNICISLDDVLETLKFKGKRLFSVEIV